MQMEYLFAGLTVVNAQPEARPMLAAISKKVR